MSVDIFMPLYIPDYLRDTFDLDATEHGAYLLLLMHLWSNGGQLDMDKERLRVLARVREADWDRVWDRICLYFTEDDAGVISQSRLSREFDKALHRSEAARVSASSRWAMRSHSVRIANADATADAVAVRSQCSSHSHSDQKNTPLPPKGGNGLTEAFAQFYQRYPRKVGKPAAIKAWQAAVKREGDELKLRDLCFKALDWQMRSPGWTKDGGQFIPHPATYLNQGRYLDEPQTGQGGKANPVSQSRHAVAAPDMRCLFHRMAGNGDRRSSEPDRSCPTCGHLSWREAPRADCNPGDSGTIVGDLFAKLGGAQ